MKKIYEFRVYDIMKDDNNREFLNKVKDENPELYDRFMSLVGNKGLEIAKQKYVQYDPEEIKKVEKESKRNKKIAQKQRKKQNYHDYIMNEYGDVFREVTEYLKTSPLKGILNIVTQEKNLKRWKKLYRTGDLKLSNSMITSFSPSKPIDKINITPRIYKNMDVVEFREDSVKIYQYVNLSRDKQSIIGYYFSIRFDFELDFIGDDFDIEKNNKINELRRSSIDLEGLKEILEMFKYYMSDKYKEDWKIEQEVGKYNL